MDIDLINEDIRRSIMYCREKAMIRDDFGIEETSAVKPKPFVVVDGEVYIHESFVKNATIQL